MSQAGFLKLFKREPQNNPIFLGLLFLLTLAPLLYGFTRFPKFLGDEGIYVSQAWWLVAFHKLGPYTYWYDHFPLGWLLIGLWQKLTGGPFAFGFSLISGRLFMILLAGISNLFLFKLIYRLTASWVLALLGSLLFLLSPLSVLLHRQVLLDNLASFWLMVSLATFFAHPQKGKRVFWASIFLSLSVLCKESIIFVVPAFWLSIYWLGSSKNRHYLLLVSLVTVSFLLGLFPLLAWLKGELLAGPDHVSFLETLKFQAQRGNQLPFWSAESEFYQKLLVWLKIDPFLILVGSGSLLLNFLFKLKDRVSLSFSLITLFFIFFLIRGGLILDFYIIPLLPFLIVEICLLFKLLIQELTLPRFLLPQMAIGGLLVLTLYLIKQGEMLYIVDATANQMQAVKRLEEVGNQQTVIVADNFPFLDLRLDRDNQPKFSRIEWYSKVEFDPVIRNKLNHDPQQIEVMLVNKTMGFELNNGQLPFLQQAKQSLTLKEKFSPLIPKEFLWLKKDLPYTVEDLELYVRSGNRFREGSKPAGVIPVSLEQKVGQLVMPALTGLTLAEVERNGLQRGIMGGVLLLDRNIKDEAQLKNLTATLRQVNPNILIAVDQEGGRVSRLPWIDNLPQTEITEENALNVAQTRGGELQQLGISVNLAPVVEKSVEPQSYVAKQNRAFAKDNGLLAAAMVKGYLAAGVVPVAKHFPGGLGKVSDDPHLTLPIVNINQPQLEQDLEPFKQVISAGVPAMMMTHLLYPEIDKNPVSSSRIFLGDILRGRLNFTGVIVVDDLSMGAVKNNFEVGEYAIESIKAGADLLLVSDQLDYQKVTESLRAAVESGRLLEVRIEESIKRINQLKL